MISRRTRAWIGLIGGILAAGLAWNGSGTTWGRSGKALVVRKTIQSAGVPGYEEGVRRLILDNPPPGTPEPGLMVLPPIFETVQEGDTVGWRQRTIPLGGIEALDLEVHREGAVAARWREGYPFLLVGIGIGGLAVGVLLWGITGLLSTLLRLSAPPDA